MPKYTFVADTKILYDYNFAALLSTEKPKFLQILGDSDSVIDLSSLSFFEPFLL